MSPRVAYLGPAGTFTEAAALQYAPKANLIPCPTITAVSAAVVTGDAEEGVVPIENSLEGPVNDTLDLLIHKTSLFIRRELVLAIEHCLLVKPGTREADIRAIYSHPQALAQCRRFIETRFPETAPMAALSTGAAAESVTHNNEKTAAAIGTLRAAELYGLEVLAKGIQDNPSNDTRFVVLGHADHAPTGDDKTSLGFSFDDDRPGLLFSVMGEFAKRGINLAKVESRPTKQSLGRYVFLIDLDGHRDDPEVKQALDFVRKQSSMLKIFGSYPRYTGSKDSQ